MKENGLSEFNGTEQTGGSTSLDAVVIGAGFAGIYALYRLRGLGLTTRVLEAGDGVGGTWFHNRYPGARCDIESLDYSYSFSNELQQEWTWSERYASQPEILRYLNHVVDRFDLRRDIQLNTHVVAAEFDEAAQRWWLRSQTGEGFCAPICVMATGVLSAAQIPPLPGLDDFEGKWYHTAAWPRDGADLRGRNVGVIGTGSSGTQLIPLLAQEAAELTVFQRTANFCMPAQNHPMDPRVEKEWKERYPERREFARASGFGHNQVSNDKYGAEVTADERREEFERRWQLGGLYMMRAFKDILTDAEVNSEAVDFVHQKIDSIVQDRSTAELLKPRNLPIGTKRLCSGTGFYETFNRPNVRLVDVGTDPIVEISTKGIRTAEAEHEVEAIVFATGFDAMTGSILRINPRGRHGRSLRDAWADGPQTYLGLAVPGFPNMFIVAGAGSPSVFSNMVTSIEQHVEWITDCVEYMRNRRIATVEAEPDAAREWVERVNDLANQTLYRHARNTWFYGANTPGKPVVFMPYLGGVGRYAETINAVAADGYSGFTFSEMTNVRTGQQAAL